MTRIAIVLQEEPDPEDEERFVALPLDTEERRKALDELWSDISPKRARELLNEMLMRAED